ncbi:MAG: hypothetical protein FWH55_03475 [Oscillospiraceae bacterium]|nr:hypothetical protein [Oscillospiraceae bacterium]
MFLRKRRAFYKVILHTLIISVAFLCVSPAVVTVANAEITAGDFDCAYICAELGILRGDGEGVTDEYLEKESVRVQAAYLTLRMMGSEDIAENYTGTDNFDDVGHLFAGGQRRTAYLKANSAKYGWQGDGTNKLMPDDILTAQQFYKVMLTVLGYEVYVDFDYADTLDFAEDEAGMFECRYIPGALTNDDLSVMLVEALLAKMKGETYTLAEFLAEEGVINYNRAVNIGIISKESGSEEQPSTGLPSTLQVEDIIAVNFAEIDVVFNQGIDKDSVDRSNIRIEGGVLEETDSVRVLEDGATLRIYRPAGFVSAQGVIRKLTLSRVKTPAGLEMAAITSKDVTFMDNQAPSLVKVSTIGLRYVKLEFSEPLRVSDSQVMNYTIYKFNGRSISTTEQIICTGREVYLPLSQSLESGQNTLTIETNRLNDLAGFPIYDVSGYTFTAEVDTTAPEVISVEAYREKVVVVFNKEVRNAVRLGWQDGSLRRNAQRQEKDQFERDIITFYFDEGSYLPVSSTEIIIDNITDMGGLPGAEYRQFVTPSLDTLRPALVDVISENANEIVLLFNKSVRVGTANSGRFTLRNENGVTVTVTPQAYTPPGASAPDSRYIKLTGNIPAGRYTLTVVNVEDMTAQANKSVEDVRQVTTLDTNPPTVVSVSTLIGESKVVVVFDKALDWSSASDISNYQYKAPGKGHVEMPSGTSVLLEADAKTVVIKFPTGGWVITGNTVTPNAFTLYIASDVGEQIRLLNIEDVAGNKMEPTVISVPSSNEVAAKLTGLATAVSQNKITMKFGNGALPVTAYSGDFIVRTTSGIIPLKSMSYSDIDSVKRELSLYLGAGYELNEDGTYGANNLQVTVTMVLPSQVQQTKTALGVPLEIETASAIVVDCIRPGLFEAFRGNRAAQNSSALGVKYPALAVNQVLVVFNKNVQFYGVGYAAQLNNMISIVAEGAPNSPLSPANYKIEAFNGNLDPSTFNQGFYDVRMIVITFSNINPPDAVSVTVNANLIWNGNLFIDGQYVLNSSFSTEYLPMLQ